MRRFGPTPSLATRVISIDIVDSPGGESVVWPSSSAVLGMQFRGEVIGPEGPLSWAGVTGLQNAARTYRYQGATGSVLVRFTPQGAACLGVPADELAGRSVPLDAVLGKHRLAESRERLQMAADDRARVAVVEELLLALPFARDPLVARALSLLDGAGDDPRVAAVAHAVGISERQLERRFKARVGLTPKQFANLRRFEHAAQLAARAHSLAAVAQEAGYFDQSHFARDFRRFTGAAAGKIRLHPR